MTLSTLKLGGTEYVVLRKKDYQQLERRAKQIDQRISRPARRNRLSAQDRGDVAEARRILADPAEKPVAYEQARKQLGLA